MSVDASAWRLTALDIANADALCFVWCQGKDMTFSGKVNKQLSMADTLRLEDEDGKGYTDVDWDEIIAMRAYRLHA